MKQLSTLVLCLLSADSVVLAALTDPTQPPRAHLASVARIQQKQVGGFVLSGVKITEEKRVAILNGQIVGVGDRVANSTVLEIHPSFVVIDYLNDERTVRLLAKQVRQPIESER
ncbi:MAG: hypothetical protein AAF384_01630 [Pseudomonadota bacterium]